MDTPHTAAYETASSHALDTRFARLRLPRPEVMGELRRSIERHGVLHPLVVNRDGDALVVLDGFKRLSVLHELALVAVPVRVVEMTTEQCKAAVVTFNAPHRGLCELEEAWVVASLVRDHKLRQVEVAELVGRHKSWVCRRLQLAERLEAGVVDDMRLGLVSATVARELARLPRGNQSAVAESIRLHRLTSRQAADLVSRVLEAEDDDACIDLLRDPGRYLDAQPLRIETTARDPRLSELGEAVRRQLVHLDQVMESTTRVVRHQLHAGIADADRSPLAERARAMCPGVDTVRALLSDLIGDDDEVAAHA